MRPGVPRLILVGCLAFLAALELEGLVGLLRDNAQRWGRVRDAIVARRPAVAAALTRGGSLSEVEAALSPGLVAEIEVFDTGGQRLDAHPLPLPLRDWPSPAELQRVREGAVVTRLSAGPPRRIVSYLSVTWRGRPAVLRIASPMVEPLLEPGDRVPVLRHGAALVLLLVIGGILLVTPASGVALAPSEGALRAYEEAMERLHAQGEQRSRHHEKERRELRSQLDDKDAMVRAGELTSGIVHEVRNGLGTITGYAQLIERGEGQAADSAARIREECATLETVVRRFVDFVRHDDLQMAPFHVARMLTRVAAREGRGRAGALVSLPQPLPEIGVVGDEEMLERAFENLVRNARAAAGEGGNVWIEIASRGEEVIVSVSDDGPGMPADQRAAIRPFTSSKGGLGLGLATALKIVHLHGGELVLAERHPRGLQASVRLPRAFAGGASGVRS